MTSQSPPPVAPGGAWKWILATLVILGAAGLYLATRPGPGPGDGGGTKTAAPKLTAAQCQRLYELRNLALGEIENALSSGNLNAALEMLEEIETLLPGDRFVPQNRAIAYIQAQQVQGKPTTPVVTIDDVLAALEELKRVDPTSAIPYLLAGKVAEATGDGERMLPEARKAAELAPNDPVAWFALAKVADFIFDDAEVLAASREALTKALELDPANSHLLRLQAKSLAETKNPDLLKVLETTRSQSALMELVRRTVDPKDDPVKIIEQAAAAVAANEWPKASNACDRLGNIIKQQHWVRSDLRRLEPNPLSYVADQFSTPVCPPDESGAAPVNRIQFVTARQIPAVPADLAIAPEAVTDLQLADANDDGRLDLVLVSDTSLTLIQRTGESWRTLASFTGSGPYSHVLIADLDRDENKPSGGDGPAPEPGTGSAVGVDPRVCAEADVDFVVYGPGGLAIVRNDPASEGAGRSLTAVPQSETFAALRDVQAALLVDFDQDGDLDLVVSAGPSMHFWRNLGDLTFEDVSSRSQDIPQDLHLVSMTPAHWDLDCFIDVVAMTAAGTAGYLENQGHSVFRWRPFEGQLAELKSPDSVLTLIDADGNVGWDLVTAGESGIRLVATRADDIGKITAGEVQVIGTAGARRLLSFDADNDSWFDLVAWTPGSQQTPQILFGSPGGRFSSRDDETAGAGAVFSEPRKLDLYAAGDLDGDGDWDLAGVGPDGLAFLENDGGNRNHWCEVRLRSQPEDKVARVNHLALGSTAEIKLGQQIRRQVVSAQFTHFGLGQNSQADALRIVWTNCVPQTHLKPKSDETICEIQVQTTSCPFLFTWNGERFEFLFDFLWGAPLGLQFAEGVLAPSRPWEYLLIPGDRLKGRQGRLTLQMTEELQEATYIDRVQLLAVDLPADVEVFSNEKVGPPSLAEFRVHTITERRAPVAARDKHGRDVLDEISLADRRFFKGFDAVPRSGRVDSHYLELDLGDLGPVGEARQILLVLSGYIYPAPTSVSIGLAQDAKNPPGSPPALWVPDAQGVWREVVPFTGFPGGKNKTIVLDLSNAFLTRDYRLRIATNFEIYWDEAFFALNEQPVELRQIPLDLVRADLHFRGFSERQTSPFHAPDTYLYDRVATHTAWLPMEGTMTRYGDVGPLLEQEDDQLVVFGFGDELTLEFAEPPPPPAGWKRDYILYNVGWDKDCDPNVILNDSVGPLPFRGMTRYPYGPDEAAPDSPEYRQYLQTYQTRPMNRLAFWRQR